MTKTLHPVKIHSWKRPGCLKEKKKKHLRDGEKGNFELFWQKSTTLTHVFGGHDAIDRLPNETINHDYEELLETFRITHCKYRM